MNSTILPELVILRTFPNSDESFDTGTTKGGVLYLTRKDINSPVTQ